MECLCCSCFISQDGYLNVIICGVWKLHTEPWRSFPIAAALYLHTVLHPTVSDWHEESLVQMEHYLASLIPHSNMKFGAGCPPTHMERKPAVIRKVPPHYIQQQIHKWIWGHPYNIPIPSFCGLAVNAIYIYEILEFDIQSLFHILCYTDVPWDQM